MLNHALDGGSHQIGAHLLASVVLVHVEHGNVASQKILVAIQLANYGADAFVAHHGQKAQVGPVVYEVSVRVDRVGLAQVLRDQLNDHGHLTLVPVLSVRDVVDDELVRHQILGLVHELVSLAHKVAHLVGVVVIAAAIFVVTVRVTMMTAAACMRMAMASAARARRSVTVAVTSMRVTVRRSATAAVTVTMAAMRVAVIGARAVRLLRQQLLPLYQLSLVLV